MTGHSLRTLLSHDHLCLAVAQELVRIANSAIEHRGVCHLALSGGETPRTIYRRLAKAPFVNAIDWKKIHIFFGDERAVPPSDQQSNFRMVDDELVSHVDIPAANIHRIHGEVRPDEAAQRYEHELRSMLGTEARFDLLLLGLGADGHTASIFPQTSAVDEDQALVCATYVPRLESWRISITLRTINNARHILFIVSGGGKAEILERVLNASVPTKDLPATLVDPKEGIVTWMVDVDAAARLQGRQRTDLKGQ